MWTGWNEFGTDFGVSGCLWSYWLLSDGPSVGSGWGKHISIRTHKRTPGVKNLVHKKNLKTSGVLGYVHRDKIEILPPAKGLWNVVNNSFTWLGKLIWV